MPKSHGRDSRVEWDDLHPTVALAMGQLKTMIALHMPDVRHAQVTFDDVKTERVPTFDALWEKPE